MSAPAIWKFPKLVVEITQRVDVPNYEARVVQGNQRGPNLLEGENPPVRRLSHAEALVEAKLRPLAESIEYVRLSPNARAEAQTQSAGKTSS
jgi:hypothetical protein